MIRSKGEAGTGDVSEATKHIRTIWGEIHALQAKSKDELYVAAKELQAPYELVREIAETGKLPVVLFTAGGVATPADAALMMQLGADGVFVGSGHLQVGQPRQARRRHREGRHLLRRRRRSSRRRRAGWARPWSASTSPTSPRRTASPNVAGNAAPPVGVLALQGDVREHLAVLTSPSGADAVPVRRPEELADVDGLVIPGGESTVDGQAVATVRPGRAAAGRASRAGLPVYGTCAGHDHARRHDPRRHRGPGDPRRARHRRAAQRVRVADRLLRGRPRRPGARAAGRCTPSSSGRRGSSGSGPAVEVARPQLDDGRGRRGRAGQSAGDVVPPGGDRRPPVPRVFRATGSPTWDSSAERRWYFDCQRQRNGRIDVRALQVGDHEAQEGGHRRPARQAVRQADQEHRGRGADGRRRPGRQPDPLRRHPEGQEDLGPERQHRPRRQARIRATRRRRRLQDDHVRGLRARRRRAAHRVPDRQPQPGRRRRAHRS